MKCEFIRFDQVTVNFDRKRVPLSSKQRSEKQGNFRYFGAQGVIDYVDDYIFDGTYLLIAEDGENLKSKKQNIAQIVEGQFWVNNHAHVLQTNERCNLRYLCYLINSMDLSGYITGSAQPKLSQSNLNAVILPLPSVEVQNSIVRILGVLDNKIELNNKINANLQQQAQAIFKSWFVDFEPFQDGEFVESELGPIPKGWKVISLENVCSVITKGTTPTTLKRRFTDCGINYIKAESISNAHFIDKNKIAYIDQETHELLSRSKIQENDILFTIAGTLGRFCMVDKENVPANTNQAVAIIRADISKIHPCVLYSYFLGDWHTEYCHTRVQQAVQANLSLGTLKNMQIPYPDEVTMEKYRSIVEPLIAEVQRTNRENVASENLRNALIPKLMNGEIDVEGVAD